MDLVKIPKAKHTLNSVDGGPREWPPSRREPVLSVDEPTDGNPQENGLLDGANGVSLARGGSVSVGRSRTGLKEFAGGTEKAALERGQTDARTAVFRDDGGEEATESLASPKAPTHAPRGGAGMGPGVQADILLYEHMDILSDAFRSAADPMAVLRQEPDGRFRYVLANPAAQVRLGGWHGLVGQYLEDVHDVHVLERLLGHAREAAFGAEREVVDVNFGSWSGEVAFDLLTARFPQHRYLLLTVRDISARKRYEKKLKRAAYRDALTNLHNRRYLDRCLKLLRKSRATYAMFYIDCDNFKSVNDRYGHDAGDAFLIQFAGRLRGTVRQRDVVVRHGGDEFIVLCRVHGLDECHLVGQRLVRALSGTYTIAGVTVDGGVSVGAACYPMQVASLEDLVITSNEALHQSKHDRKGELTVYRATSPRVESLLKR